MAIKIKCPKPECQKVLQVPEDMGGKKGKCSNCGTTFLIPNVEAPAASPPPSKPAPQKPAPKKPAPRPQADHVEDFDIDDDFSPEPVGRGGGRRDDFDDFDDGYDDRPSRGRRSAPAQDYDDFDDGYDDDGFDDYDDYGGGGSGGGSYQAMPRAPKKASWKWVKTGMFIAAIGFSVFAGTVALRLLNDLLFLILAIMAEAGSRGGGGFAKAIDIIAKINAPIAMGGMAAIVTGLGFCIASTSRGGVMAIAISSTVVAAGELIMRLITKVVFIFSRSQAPFDHFIFYLGRLSTARKVGSLLADLLLVAVFVLVSILLSQIAKQTKVKSLHTGGMTGMYMAIAFGGVSLIFHILTFINVSSMTAARVMGWIGLVMNIAIDVCMGLAAVFYFTTLFGAKRKMR